MANTPQYYWSLRKTSPNTTLPFLQRTGANFNNEGIASFGNSALPQRIFNPPKSIQAINPIDVVNDFQWTKSPKTSRNTTPSITLIEKRLLMNSNIANLANSVFAGAGSIATITGQQGLLQQGIDGAPNYINAAANAIQNLPTTVNNSTNPLVKNTITQSLVNNDYVKALASSTASGLRAFSDNYNSYKLENPVLKPYEFLYSTENTGFKYILPYFENDYFNSNISFGESEQNLASGVANILGNFATGAGGIAGTLQPGTYIEKSKQFSMGDTGRTINIKFPLLNTGEYKDIIENWQLIFGLLYQNRPGRVTRSIIDVPVIYEVYSQGMVYMPFAFINSFSVNFLGARRKMGITVPVGSDSGGTTYMADVIIPDAYEVNITLQGLNDESRNFLYASVERNNVTVNSNTATQSTGANTATLTTRAGGAPTTP